MLRRCDAGAVSRGGLFGGLEAQDEAGAAAVLESAPEDVLAAVFDWPEHCRGYPPE